MLTVTPECLLSGLFPVAAKKKEEEEERARKEKAEKGVTLMNSFVFCCFCWITWIWALMKGPGLIQWWWCQLAARNEKLKCFNTDGCLRRAKTHYTHTHVEIFSAWSMREMLVFTHVVFSLRWEAERLRKQWEEEEEERLKQTSAPAKPKGKMTLPAQKLFV